MSIRITVLSFLVLGLSIYAWRNWFRALCGAVVIMAFTEHHDMPRHIFGIEGFNLWNLLVLNVLGGWLSWRNAIGVTTDMNGDLLTTLDFRQMLQFHREQEADFTVGVFPREVKIDFGVIQFDSAGAFRGYDEKPTYHFEVSMAHQKVDMRSATTEWLRTERACGRVISKIPPKDIFTVKYEEVCHEPRKATGKIFEFAGLDGDDLPLGIVAPQLHILGNAMRLNPDKSITLDEKWKRQLLPKELEAFDAIAGDYNRSRGYR